jgi:hypothetical protein
MTIQGGALSRMAMPVMVMVKRFSRVHYVARKSKK